MIARNARANAAEHQEAGSWVAGQQAQAEAERAARCTPVAEVRTRCDALRASAAKDPEDLSACEIEQKFTERACAEATTTLQTLVEYRKTRPPPAPPPSESPPICRAE